MGNTLFKILLDLAAGIGRGRASLRRCIGFPIPMKIGGRRITYYYPFQFFFWYYT
jgi:hypothetical protein